MSAILSLLPQQGYNASLLSTMSPTSLQPPFYHTANANLLSWMPDRYLALAGPIVGYWVLSLVFHLIDTAELPYFEKRRIHESPEVLSRNKATIGQVVRAVAVQQILQTILGYVWLEDDATIFEREVNKDHLAIMSSMTPAIANLTVLALGQRTGEQVLKTYGPELVRWTYWWGVPILRMLFAL
jgi:sphinganine C4-monooxygenase